MKRKSFRSLAVFLAALIVFITIPVMPIFAASSVESITIKVNSQIKDFSIYDGAKSLDEAFVTEECWANLVESGTKQSPSQIKINGTDYTITSVEEGFKLSLQAGGNFTGNINLGIYVSSDVLNYEAQDATAVPTQGVLELTPDTYDDSFYYAIVPMSFLRGPFSKFTGNVDLTFSVPAPTHLVTWDDSLDFHIEQDGGSFLTSPVEVTENQPFTFVLAGIDSSKTPVVMAQTKDGREPLEPIDSSQSSQGKYKYQIDKVTSDTKLIVALYPAVKVSFDRGTGCTVTENNPTIPYGSKEDYTFTVTAQPGYKVDEVTATCGTTSLSVTGPQEAGKYTVAAPNPEKGFTNDVVITVATSQLTYNVTLKGESVTDSYSVYFNSSTTGIPYNGSVSFTVTPKPGYDAPDVSIDKTENGTLNGPAPGGAYSITGIKGDVQIIVEGKAINAYKVNLPTEQQQIGYTIEVTGDNYTDGNPVPYGTELTVKAIVKEDYSQSAGALKLYVNGVEQVGAYEAGSRTYTYTVKVTAETNITVSTLTRNTYSVTVPNSTDKYTVNGSSQTLQHGGSYNFTVTLNDSYKFNDSEAKNLFSSPSEIDDNVVTVKMNDEKTIFTVTIQNINKNLTFVVKDNSIDVKTFKVETPKNGETDGFQVSGISQSVNYNGSVSFMVTPNTGYRITEVAYTSGGAKNVLTSSSNSYTISGIKADCQISVTCVPIVITVKYTKNAVNGFGLSFPAETITEKYDVKNNNAAFETSAGLKLKENALLKPDRSGFTTTGWFMNGKPIEAYIELEGTNDQTIELTCSYTLVSPGESSGGKTTGPVTAEAVDPSTEDVGVDKRKEKWACKVEIAEGMSESDRSVIQNAITSGNFKIKSYGMLYSTSSINTPAQYIDQIKGLTGSQMLPGGTVYCYYHSNADERLKYGGTYTEKITVANDAGNRYGVIWFVITVNGTDYVVFGEPKTIEN